MYHLIYKNFPVVSIVLMTLETTENSKAAPIVFSEYAIDRCIKHFIELRIKVSKRLVA